MQGDHARSRVRGSRFGDIRWVSETGSTNDDAMVEARAGTPEGLVFVADSQIAGRGRLGRTWQASPGSSLLFSVLLRPKLSLEETHLAVHAVALAGRIACSEVAGLEPDLKWPNDLLEPGGTRKLGGILAESLLEGDRLAALVVGMGLNVEWPDSVPEELTGIAVALNHLGSTGGVDREELLAVLLNDLDSRCEMLETREGRERLADEYHRECSTIGQVVRVGLTDGSGVTGIAEQVRRDGALLVRDESGQVHVIVAGDVVHLRPE